MLKNFKVWSVLLVFKVVEFIKGSGIFIKGYALKNIQETQLKQTCFARALMKVVFKKDALAICSLSGRSSSKSTKNNKISSEDGKPGLYEEGVNAIISKFTSSTTIFYRFYTISMI